MDDLAETLSRMKGRWMIGGTALDLAPADWREAAGADATKDAELALLAIAGQASQIAVRPHPGVEPTLRAALPKLALPVLPERHRAAFRRIRNGGNLMEGERNLLRHFLAARGYVVHPADDMPGRAANPPDIYAPWLDWKAGNVGATPAGALSAETWDTWQPAARNEALRTLRREAPKAARILLEARAADLPADTRLRAVATLAQGLSDDDIPYLQQLTKDRSSKVQAFATQLLSRLGAHVTSNEKAAELAALFAQDKTGLLSKKTTVTSKRVKTNAQRHRRDTLMAQVSLSGLARALGLSTHDLILGWSADDTGLCIHFAEMVAESGNDAECALLARRCGAFEGFAPEHLAPLAPRLTRDQRKDLFADVLRHADASLTEVSAWAEGLLGQWPAQIVMAAPSYDALRARLIPKADASPTRRDQVAEAGLFTLGLLLDQAGAALVLDDLASLGLHRADAMLAPLALNASLTPGDRP